MCGIWGAINGGDRINPEAAARAMYHRGPDDHGIHTADGLPSVALVNARLSILDLSPAGHQPMSTPDGRYTIVYNGEVYNFRETRAELQRLGHVFISDSDTEVILHAYAQWGPACLDRFRGMFAIAIWDDFDKTLFLARDRLGIKPLYYNIDKDFTNRLNSKLYFASELKALIAGGGVQPMLNDAAVHHYLSFYSVPAPMTILQDVLMLPPGHYLLFEEGSTTLKPYWSLATAKPLELSETDIRARLRDLLEESIRLRMIADVPVGAFLSGGIDSAAVVALMTRASGETLRTFSVGFGDEGASIDERSAARTMAEFYKTDHTEVIVTGQQVRDQFSQIIRAIDQPSGDGLNTYLVSQATGAHIKVALSGLGGDELFAGYPQFRLFQQADRAASIWNRVPGGLRGLIRVMGGEGSRISRMINWMEGDFLTRYRRVRMLFDEDEKSGLYTSKMVARLAAPEPSYQFLSNFIHPAEEFDSITQVTRMELLHYMTHTLLRDTDAMGMAHSLEVRVPLIDHELVEFATTIPSSMKLQGSRPKPIFADALADILPAEVLKRPKRGFEMPVAAWMRGPLHDLVEETFNSVTVARRGMFQYDAMQSIYNDFMAGEGPYMRAWAFVVLEHWTREFLD